MLEYVDALAREPWNLRRQDVDALRAHGWTDADVVQIVLGAAHFGYLNRMADGLGIRLEYESDLPALPTGPSQTSPPRPADPRGGPRGRRADPGGPAPGAEADSSPDAWVPVADDPASAPPGGPRNLYRAVAANPEAAALAREWRAFQLRPTPGLDGPTRARLALFVAGLESCLYGVHWFAGETRRLGAGGPVAAALARGEAPQGLGSRDRALLAHAERLTREPWSTREGHLHDLRSVGLDDVAILQLTMLVSYVAFESRLALGLGVPLEAEG